MNDLIQYFFNLVNTDPESFVLLLAMGFCVGVLVLCHIQLKTQPILIFLGAIIGILLAAPMLLAKMYVAEVGTCFIETKNKPYEFDEDLKQAKVELERIRENKKIALELREPLAELESKERDVAGRIDLLNVTGGMYPISNEYVVKKYNEKYDSYVVKAPNLGVIYNYKLSVGDGGVDNYKIVTCSEQKN